MIRVEHLCKRFGELTVLHDVSAEIRKGEVIAVIGPSGSGKSTFLRCLNLLETPTSGRILVDGVSLLDPATDVSAIRRRMGMVFQSFNLWSHLSVMGNLTLGPIHLLRKSREEAMTRAMELLRLVGLAEKAGSYPAELSGGQKQRVAIARCLAMDPEILLFDEPTSALDPTMVSEVLAVIRRLSSEGMTMVIVTHEMEFARNTATRMFYMDEGGIYEEGSPDQIFDTPLREKTNAFIKRVRSLRIHITSKDYDLYAMHAEMQTFCEKHLLDRELTLNTQLMAEEVLGLMPDIRDTTLNLSYSEKDGDVILTVESPGSPFNPLEHGERVDDIGIRLIRGRCRNVEYRYDAGVNILLLDLRAQ
ncbi:MAG TPA: amino acid ABC transporter ATP-binding protein [Bacteroidales bacterium]|nr:amino acid ABC transporter ATP-binding protein [Bacteroidales bacterium]HSA44313.1 amino acid ABC transporter ATP-binding protein [Bacteroidales bacterium]